MLDTGMRSIRHNIALPSLLSIVMLLAATQGKAATPENAEGVARPTPLLISDSPSTLGVAEDGVENTPRMDFSLSVRYPLLYGSNTEKLKSSGGRLPFLGFNVKMAQYFNLRSAPVITRQFNPRLMVRTYSVVPEGETVWVDDSDMDYYDLGYAHESNGQYINSKAAFDAQVQNLSNNQMAVDYIHRGWDYLDYARHLHFEMDRIGVLDLELKYFLNHGLLERNRNELYSWEPQSAVSHIGQVDGIRVKMGAVSDSSWFKNANLTLMTGYRSFLRYNSFRFESTVVPLSGYFGTPVMLWWQSGYDNSVATFNIHSWSAGAVFSFQTSR